MLITRHKTRAVYFFVDIFIVGGPSARQRVNSLYSGRLTGIFSSSGLGIKLRENAHSGDVF